MNYLSVENVSKAYGDKTLFENISFGIDKGQKVALVAKNGTGKSTLLKILVDQESPDTGQLSFRKDIQVGFLTQDPQFGDARTILEAVLYSQNPVIQAIRFYEECLQNPDNQDKMQEALLLMDNHKAWDYEVKIKQILSKLSVGELQKSVDKLSGGQRKRVALAKILIDEPDFLILDEPTNHLDLDMIEWLEEYLSGQQVSLLMVTHDRYFLERVCNVILELDQGTMFRYPGNYSYYLQNKAEREQQEIRTVEKARNLMRKELDWIRRQPKARGTKSKARIDAFQELKKTAQKDTRKKELELGMQTNRLGKKIIELNNLQKSYGELKILTGFSYNFKRGEKVGIVGRNGVGKSTFLHILTQDQNPDAGEVIKGETVVFGYYKQDGIQLAEDKRVIEVVQDIAEYIPISSGHKLSASQLLERFLFSPKAQYAYVSTLSGGEKRRLYLLTILAQSPNFLILDEPTNDLDILTLNVLEDFLQDFMGCIVIVTHDRYFMDKLVDHLFIFEGDGIIRDFNGPYSEYRAVREFEAEQAALKAKAADKVKPKAPEKTKVNNFEKRKLSYKEQKEYESLELEIEELEKQKENIEEILNSGSLSHDELMQKSAELGQIMEQIDQKTDRWLELGEYI